jgi:UPF0271 protein
MHTYTTIDLNADAGESFGTYELGNDEELFPYVSSVNIACGFHAGDPAAMKKTVRLAMATGKAIGAHPGLPDLQGFGRRNLAITAEEAYDMVLYQTGALWAFVKAEGGVLHHVKPHGALYNMAAKDASLAGAIAQAVYDINPQLILYGLSGSELIKASKHIGLRAACEVFADRTYQADGSLTPRSKPGALISDPQQAVQQVLRMVKEGKVSPLAGEEVTIKADTICIHGDGPHAVKFARMIYAALSLENIVVRAFNQ